MRVGVVPSQVGTSILKIKGNDKIVATDENTEFGLI
jgi:hypothetical protein